MLIIFAVILSTALANSHEKYIDLLPEEEKQEFLNKVARRILETVDNSENSDKTSKELKEEDLKVHHKFVQDILKEESGHIRRRRADRNSDDEIEASENSGPMENRRADDRSSDDENNASERLEVKPLKSESNKGDDDKIDKSSDTDNANSSAYGIKRFNDESMQESPNDHIKVEIVTDKVLPMMPMPMHRTSNTDDASYEPKTDTRSSKSSKKVITNRELKNIKSSTADVKRHTVKPKYAESTTKSQDLRLEGTNNTASTINERKNEYIVSNSSLSNKNNSNLNIKSESKSTAALPPKEDIYTLTSTTAASVIHRTHKDLEGENKPITLVTSGKYSTTKPTPSNTIINSSTDSGTKDIFIDLTSYLNTTKLPSIHKYSSQSPKVFESKMAIKEKVPKRIIPKIASKLKSTTTRLPGLTPTNIMATPTKKIIKIKKKTENSTIITFISSNPLKKSKSEFNLNMPKPNIQKTYKKQTSLQPYQVYEIPWPESSQDKPFLRDAEPMQDQPHFVPVYKYSPNYAFYNPSNRRGPNAVEENSIELDTNPLRKGEIEGEKRKANEFILQLNDELRKFGVYKKKPEEYAEETVAATTPGDEEHSRENTVIQLPDSYENVHPYHAMNNGLKTHIKAVRNVLLKKKLYNTADVPKEDHIKFLYSNKSVPVVENRLGRGRSHDQEFPALRNYHVHNGDIDINYYFKALQRLQDQDSNEVHDMNELLMISHANDNNNDHTAAHEAIKDEQSNMNTISKILNVTDEKDFVDTLEKLQKINLKLMRRNEDIKVGIYMKVLKDLIQKDSNALKQYDWLATTVQIQSALDKLSQLIERQRNSVPIHPADVQILKYTVFIHNFSLELRGANEIKNKLRKKGRLLPRGKLHKKKIITEKGLINRNWLYKRTLLPDLTADKGLKDLHEFIVDIEDALFDLHESITNIAKITKFKHQNWFENIKDLYLTTNEKHLREILLHLSFARLVELIEKSCENGLEKDFIQYMKTHKTESKRTLEEILFVLNILDQIKNNL